LVGFIARDYIQEGRVLQAWAARVDQGVAYVQDFEAGGAELAPGRRLRIGYLSGSGFHNSTTTARSMRSQYGLHDRARVEVWCYACQGDDGSEPRATIRRGCDHFVEAAGWGHVRLAERIRADGINVLIDLTGYTLNTQTEVLAIGPARIQVQTAP
jgi:protein O-GlcNAc transferase